MIISFKKRKPPRITRAALNRYEKYFVKLDLFVIAFGVVNFSWFGMFHYHPYTSTYYS